MKNFAQLKPTCPFYSLFAGGLVPIVNIIAPSYVECIGDGLREVYMVDLAKLGPEELELLARAVHHQCDPNSNFEEAKAEMIKRGLPLRAKHVATVSTDVPWFL